MEASAFDRPVHASRHRTRRLRRSDAALAARVRAGDERAFEDLYDRYAAPLLAFTRHLVGTLEEAEDVLQHTFMAAHRAFERGDEPEHVKAWLYTIARNRSLSVLRARREQVALDEDGAAVVSTRGLAAEVEERGELRALVGDLHRLPDDQRAALVLFELGDNSQDEIAEVLGVRREKVKALVFQARESLIGFRTARETPCADVREQLSTLRGSALRRAPLRRHVEVCVGCREFEAQVRHQRAALAVVLPVVPAAGLKSAVLSSALGGSAAATAAGTSATAGATAAATAGPAATGVAVAGKGIAAKALVALAIAGGAGGAGYVAVENAGNPPAPAKPPAHSAAAQHSRAAAAKAAAAGLAGHLSTATGATATTAGATTAGATHGQGAAHRSSKAHPKRHGSTKSRGHHTGVGKAKGTPATPANATPTRAHGTTGAPGQQKKATAAPSSSSSSSSAGKAHVQPSTAATPTAPASKTASPPKVKTQSATPGGAGTPAIPATGNGEAGTDVVPQVEKAVGQAKKQG